MSTPRTLVLAVVLAPWVIRPVLAEPLWPSVGERVAANAAAVGTSLSQAVDDFTTLEGDRLRAAVDPDAGVRVYHRDDRLLFALTARRNLSPGEKLAAERTASSLAREVLTQRFRHLLETPTGFQGLDTDSIRVVLVEPDAYQPYVRSTLPGRGLGSGSMGPVPFAAAGFWAAGSQTVTACVGCSSGCP
jgi:hypothetical protein